MKESDIWWAMIKELKLKINEETHEAIDAKIKLMKAGNTPADKSPNRNKVLKMEAAGFVNIPLLQKWNYMLL